MSVAVVIPFAGEDRDRVAALRYVQQKYRAAALDVVVGNSDPQRWCKADAVAAALASCDADVLVVADADVWSDGTDHAIAHVLAGNPWAVPHTRVHRLTEASTYAVLTGAPVTDRLPLAQRTYTGVIGGGLVVLRRDVYEDCPLDRRFVGWGGEDHCWGYALQVLYGKPARFNYPLWHLWHRPQPGDNEGYGSLANTVHVRRYQRARRFPHQMRELVAEGKADAACLRDG